jgi:branched-chain amino acid transport system substrate-binding protein
MRDNFTVDRRKLLLGGAGLAASSLASPFVSPGFAAEPIKIGPLWAKTGQIAEQAEYLAQGNLLALAQRSDTLPERKVETVWLDEPNP